MLMPTVMCRRRRLGNRLAIPDEFAALVVDFSN
jgi:hypothetical protein